MKGVMYECNVAWIWSSFGPREEFSTGVFLAGDAEVEKDLAQGDGAEVEMAAVEGVSPNKGLERRGRTLVKAWSRAAFILVTYAGVGK